MIKSLVFLLILLNCVSGNPLIAQDSCFGGRYLNTLFPSVSQVDVQYGQNIDINNQPVNLMMRIFQPIGDTAACRPLVILMHGGGWVSGSYTDPGTTGPCTRLSRRGYVTASAGYRLGVQNGNYAEAIYRGMQDLKAAVRWFRANASAYGIDTSQIFVGGFSAGAINAIHAAYWDLNEVSSSIISSWGNFEASGNPGYPDVVHGVMSASGSIQNTSWLNNETIPFVAVHDAMDAVVPYYTTGSYAIHNNLLTQGTASHLYTLNGANPPNNHVYSVNPYDTYVRDTLYRILSHHSYALISQNSNTLQANAGSFYQWYTNGNPVNGATGQSYMPPTSGWYYVQVSNCAGCYSVSDSVWFQLTGHFSDLITHTLIVYPNPTSGRIFINSGPLYGNVVFTIHSIDGKLLHREDAGGPENDTYTLNLAHLPEGIFLLRIVSGDKTSSRIITVIHSDQR